MESKSLYSEARKKRALIECFQMRKVCGRGTDIFCGANFQIQAGELVLLIGANGSGKSTLMRLLLGLETLNEGHILINGRNLQHLRKAEIPYFRRRVGVVFQDLKLVMRRTVFENVALPLQVLGRDRLFIRKKVHRVLASLGLDHSVNRPCSYLSEAECRLTAVARAVVHDPIILLLDEPAANLDQNALLTVLDSIRAAHGRGSTVIITTHDRSMPSHVPESRLAAIEGGKIFDKDGSGEEAFAGG